MNGRNFTSALRFHSGLERVGTLKVSKVSRLDLLPFGRKKTLLLIWVRTQETLEFYLVSLGYEIDNF